MKYTGYKDMNEDRVCIGDTVYSPRRGAFIIKYRVDRGGLVMCPASEDSDSIHGDGIFHDLTYLAGNGFTIVGHKDDHPDEINKKIVAIIARKPG